MDRTALQSPIMTFRRYASIPVPTRCGQRANGMVYSLMLIINIHPFINQISILKLICLKSFQVALFHWWFSVAFRSWCLPSRLATHHDPSSQLFILHNIQSRYHLLTSTFGVLIDTVLNVDNDACQAQVPSQSFPLDQFEFMGRTLCPLPYIECLASADI